MAIELYKKGDHAVIMFEDLVECEGSKTSSGCDAVQASQFLIVNNGRAALIDPGGNLTYNNLRMELFEHVHIKHLDYVVASHQDPDIVASLNKWLVATDCQALVPQLWARFVPHFCTIGNTQGRIVGIPDQGANIRLGNAVIKALPAHFLHSEGNFHFYDPISKILLTGDMGASMVTAEDIAKPVENFDEHVRHMEGFHRRYMNSNRACRLWANMARQLDIEYMVPQHGRYFAGKRSITRFLDWIENLQCGVDLMTEASYRVPA